MAFIYILQSTVNQRFYIGSTNDLDRRLFEHGRGHTKSTRLTRPFKLVFYKKYDTISKARAIERKLKLFKSRTIIENIIESQNITLDC